MAVRASSFPTNPRTPLNPRSTPVRKAFDQALVHALESHIKTLQGENEALKEQLVAAEARAAQEAARADKAVDAIASLARALDELAEKRRGRGWRRLLSFAVPR